MSQTGKRAILNAILLGGVNLESLKREAAKIWQPGDGKFSLETDNELTLNRDRNGGKVVVSQLSTKTLSELAKAGDIKIGLE